jgi:hypothetical protein
MDLIWPVINSIMLILSVGGALLGVFAVVDAGTRRPDAFAAADKQTKGVWGGITAACAAVSVLGFFTGGDGAFGALSLLWLAALVGELVYLLDVRPKLREVQRGSRW